jgi:hypothetical protein
VVVGQVLVVSKGDDLWGGDAVQCQTEWEEAIGDGVLDYEFQHPAQPHSVLKLDVDERESLEALVQSDLIAAARSALPKWVKSYGQAHAYLDAWYRGDPPYLCAQFAKDEGTHGPPGDPELGIPDPRTAFDWDRSPHPIVAGGEAASHAAYLVGAHRLGHTVFGDSPIAQVCAKHVFSEWPTKIFQAMGTDYATIARSVRAPGGVAIELPPLLALVLSRAERRAEIPFAIRELREQYDDVRRKLWRMLEKMWKAPTLSEQLKIARALNGAAGAVVAAAFPERLDVLDMAIGVSQMRRSPERWGN